MRQTRTAVSWNRLVNNTTSGRVFPDEMSAVVHGLPCFGKERQVALPDVGHVVPHFQRNVHASLYAKGVARLRSPRQAVASDLVDPFGQSVSFTGAIILEGV